MTITEAAAYLEVGRDLMWKLCRHGKIAHTRVGFGRGTIRIDKDALDDYKRSCLVPVEEREAAPPTERKRRLNVPNYLAEYAKKPSRERSGM